MRSMADTSLHLLIPGDIVIGAVFPVHNKGKFNQISGICEKFVNHMSINE